jgi:hypothetical protein
MLYGEVLWLVFCSYTPLCIPLLSLLRQYGHSSGFSIYRRMELKPDRYLLYLGYLCHTAHALSDLLLRILYRARLL